MEVLVTGVSGFSASYVATALADAGHEVTGLYRHKTQILEHLEARPDIKLIQAQLADIEKIEGRFSAIIHAAASMRSKGVGTQKMIADNVSGTLSLLNAAQKWGSRSLIFFSSVSLFGDIKGPILDEQTPIIAPDVYGITKLLCERILAEAEFIPTLALRLPGILGVGAHSNWLSGVAAKLRAGQPIEAFSLDAPFNNAAHIDDIAKLVAGTLNRSWTGTDAIVLGARGAITVRAAIEKLSDALGVTAHIIECPPKKTHFLLSSDRAIAHWGYEPMEIGAMVNRYGREIAGA